MRVRVIGLGLGFGINRAEHPTIIITSTGAGLSGKHGRFFTLEYI